MSTYLDLSCFIDDEDQWYSQPVLNSFIWGRVQMITISISTVKLIGKWDWIAWSIYDNHCRLNSQPNWAGDLYGHLMSTGIFNLIMKESIHMSSEYLWGKWSLLALIWNHVCHLLGEVGLSGTSNQWRPIYLNLVICIFKFHRRWRSMVFLESRPLIICCKLIEMGC